MYAAVCYSENAHGEIISIDLSEAEKVKGVKLILTAKDIPGENQIGGIVQDEELLAKNKVEFIGQPIAVVVAENQKAAKSATRLVKVKIKDLPVVTDARASYEAGQFIVPPRTFSLGNVDDCWKACDYIVEGTVESGGQEHLYIETQGAMAFPVAVSYTHLRAHET